MGSCGGRLGDSPAGPAVRPYQNVNCYLISGRPGRSHLTSQMSRENLLVAGRVL